MPSKRAIALKCPICKTKVTAKSPDFPFCSERCRLIDLGKWANGSYVISAPVHDISDVVPNSAPRPEEPDED